MVNSQIIKETQEAYKTDIRVEKIPTALPVVEVGLKGSKCAHIVRGIDSNNSTATTIYTTPTDQDFYLTFASLVFKSATTGQATLIRLKVVIDSVDRYLLGLPNFTATGTTSPANIFNAGNHPIKVDRGTTIQILADVADAEDRVYASIAGYLDEVA